MFLVSSKSAAEYFSGGWIKYLVANLTFLNTLQLSLPGVFEGHRETAINGALWTMKIEVMFYAAVPMLVYMFKRFGRLPIIVLAYLLSIAYVFILGKIFERTGAHVCMVLARQFPGQLAYFMVGAAAYYYLPLFERYIKILLPAGAMVLFLDHSYALPLLSPIALGILVIFCALFFYMGNFSKYGDFSYGIYILHFPIIQILLDSGWFKGRPFAFLASVIVLTAIGAMTIWNVVESRFIRRAGASIPSVVTPGIAVGAAAQVVPKS
jgi:peptidoglycan/LPS O-acetylase OafA/YrhL